jgi:PAS domain S-box-containing protein
MSKLAKQLEKLGVDLAPALEQVRVPAYLIDREGRVRWLNEAARALVGDVRGRRATSIVAPEDIARVQTEIARKLLGTAAVTNFEVRLVAKDGRYVPVEVSSVALRSGERIIGIFGLTRPPGDFELAPRPERAAPHLTPRQFEVLNCLEQGASTRQIAEVLGISEETVRNHVRGLLRRLGQHSRIAAVAYARQQGLLPPD